MHYLSLLRKGNESWIPVSSTFYFLQEPTPEEVEASGRNVRFFDPSRSAIWYMQG